MCPRSPGCNSCRESPANHPVQPHLADCLSATATANLALQPYLNGHTARQSRSNWSQQPITLGSKLENDWTLLFHLWLFRACAGLWTASPVGMVCTTFFTLIQCMEWCGFMNLHKIKSSGGQTYYYKIFRINCSTVKWWSWRNGNYICVHKHVHRSKYRPLAATTISIATT